MYSQIDSNKYKSIALIAIFVAFLVALGFAYDYAYGSGGLGGVFFAILISVFMTGVSYFAGDKIALSSSGARAITKKENTYLYNIVENLSITAGIPMPKVYIIPDAAINAFATGRDPLHASIAVTEGALKKLENEELEGVLAHELSHVKNFDTRLIMLVIVLVGAIGLLADMFWRARFFGFGGGRRDNDHEGGNALFMIIGLAIILLSPLIAQLIKFALSRRREFLADASGALLTRYPEGLARALEKIGIDKAPMAHANATTAPLYFTNPLSGKNFINLFSTHPPLEARVKALRGMA
ncbi:MAG: M48 family metalloprotease [Candidatus Magasanikbacteria bacterium]|nr:M48 family metalloprotease [Candidatus Magasanikbacteria bacterium]